MNKRSTKFRIINKTKFILVLTLAFAVALTCIAGPVSGKEASGDQVYVEYTVTLGDTLWSIAERYNYKNEDIRKMIYDIKQINDLDVSVIEYGQTLMIPISPYEAL